MLVAKKILIIDDSATVRQQVRKALADASFEVVEAEDGVEGLDVILGREDLAAVLCDVNMPRSCNGQRPLAPTAGSSSRSRQSCSSRRFESWRKPELAEATTDEKSQQPTHRRPSVRLLP